jgi:ankyrin repeat protein
MFIILRKRRGLFAFLVATIAALSVWLVREDRQQRLNRELIAAIEREDVPAALLALDRGADANARDKPAEPVWRTLSDRLRRQAPASYNYPSTPLVLSLVWPRSPLNAMLVQALINHRARPNDRGGWLGLTPIWLAVSNGDSASTRVLLEHGASPTLLPPRWDGYRWFFPSRNLLILALERRQRAVAEDLVERGFDVNSPQDDGMTALGAAVMWGDPSVTSMLLRHGAAPNTPFTYVQYNEDWPPYRSRPLECAELRHLIDIAKLLRAAGARDYRRAARR